MVFKFDHDNGLEFFKKKTLYKDKSKETHFHSSLLENQLDKFQIETIIQNYNI